MMGKCKWSEEKFNIKSAVDTIDKCIQNLCGIGGEGDGLSSVRLNFLNVENMGN